MSGIISQFSKNIVNQVVNAVAPSAVAVVGLNLPNPRAATVASIAAEIAGGAFGIVSKSISLEETIPGYLISSTLSIGIKTIIGKQVGNYLDSKFGYTKMLQVSLATSFLSVAIPSGIGAVISNFNATLPFNLTA